MTSRYGTDSDPRGRSQRASSVGVGDRDGAHRSDSGRSGGIAPEPGQYLVFRIGTELYAVSVLEANEVLEYRAPTPVPGAPAWISGMLSLRGRPVPILDLAAKFGVSHHRTGATSCIVVLDLVVDEEPSQVGIVVDDVPAVIHLGDEQIAEPPQFGTIVHVRYLRGMARLDSGLVLLLDAAGALTAEDAALLSSLEARAGAGGPARAPSAGAGASGTNEESQG
jgi:purine-binding chemotaxis protein CheW